MALDNDGPINNSSDLDYFERMFIPHNVSCVTCHVSCVMCHVSCVTCHVSPVTCHVSRVTCKKNK